MRTRCDKAAIRTRWVDRVPFVDPSVVLLVGLEAIGFLTDAFVSRFIMGISLFGSSAVHTQCFEHFEIP